jgi:hypothetical protein
MEGPDYRTRAVEAWDYATEDEQEAMAAASDKPPWELTDSEIVALLSAEARLKAVGSRG